MRTLAEIDSEIAKYEATQLAILLRGQSYTVDGRSLSRADLPFIAGRLKELRIERARAERRGVRISYGTPQ